MDDILISPSFVLNRHAHRAWAFLFMSWQNFLFFHINENSFMINIIVLLMRCLSWCHITVLSKIGNDPA